MESSDTAFWAIIAMLLVAAMILWFLYRHRRTAALRDRFGEDEYARTLDAKGDRGKAETDLIEREKRVRKLEIRPLEAAERERLTAEWHTSRERFVDDPGAAVSDADQVLGKIMAGRGFPVSDFDERYETLTVDHPDVARHYRAGHDLALKQDAGSATTEELRQAMIHYEALFDELVDDPGEARREDPSRTVQRA